MSDGILNKVKKVRDNNPILDFAAGFIPFVGEAQDAHDFYHAAKKGDFGGMALASLGFVIPGVTGGHIGKGIKLASKVADKVSDSRRFAKASEAPIYTRETAPKTLKLSDKDITEMHLNDGAGSEQLFDRELISSLNKRFADADHGTAVRIGNSLQEADLGLSGKSAPLFYSITNRWARQGKGGYFIPEGESATVKLNKVAQMVETPDGKVMPKFDQKFVDDLNKKIQQINELGYNFPNAELQRLPNKFKPGHPLYEHYEKHPVMGEVVVPNIGFLKYKYGGNIKR